MLSDHAPKEICPIGFRLLHCQAQGFKILDVDPSGNDLAYKQLSKFGRHNSFLLAQCPIIVYLSLEKMATKQINFLWICSLEAIKGKTWFCACSYQKFLK